MEEDKIKNKNKDKVNSHKICNRNILRENTID